MLLLSIKKYKVVLAIPLFLVSLCLAADNAFSKEEESSNFYQAFSNLIESAPEDNKHLLDGWNDYLTKVLGYSNAEHLKAIEELTIDYAKAFKAIDEKYAKDREQDKINYTSKWLDELVERFGKDFVSNNKRAVMLNLMMAFNRSDAKKYDQDAKDILSKELTLYLAYESYLGVFMDYYNQLSEQDQKKMKAWKEVAEKYLSITKSSHFAFIYYGSRMKYKILDNVMQKGNKELYIYFKKRTFPFGSWAFSKARQDMDMFIETCKTQSLNQPENNKPLRAVSSKRKNE
jgi:hypothetical protein